MEDKPVPLKPAQLQIDLENPRLPEALTGQREAFRALAERQNEKLLALAEHIVLHRRLHPAELPIVMRSEHEQDRYIVLEGNRRLTALKALETPELFIGALKPEVLDRMRKLSAEYKRNPVEQIYCIVAADRPQAEPWIVIRHNGESGGAGLVDWGEDEKAKFGRRRGRPIKLHTRILDYLQDGGHLTVPERERITTTTLERLLKSDELCAKLGIEKQHGGKFRIVADEGKTIAALLALVRRLMDGALPVIEVYRAKQRDEWVHSFSPEAAVTGSVPTVSGSGIASASAAGGVAAAAPKRQQLVRIPRDRPFLIPNTCPLGVKDVRVKAMEVELRKLELESFPNAVSVLFRVFLELSADYYRAHVLKRGPYAVKDHLGDKLLDVVEDLEKKAVLDKWQANPVRAACQKNSFLLPSVVMMHEYIHNRHNNPSPTDLRNAWDSLQPFIVALWPR